MSRRTFTGVKPIRYEEGSGWVETEPHRAQQWAVILNGQKITTRPTKRAAESSLGSEVLRAAGPKRQYKLGRRMPPRD